MREGRILDPEKLFFDEQGYADEQVDCEGSIVAPGFIDIQINGTHAHAHTHARKHTQFSADRSLFHHLRRLRGGLLPALPGRECGGFPGGPEAAGTRRDLLLPHAGHVAAFCLPPGTTGAGPGRAQDLLPLCCRLLSACELQREPSNPSFSLRFSPRSGSTAEDWMEPGFWVGAGALLLSRRLLPKS